jgi:putative peptidoglycan lipid II flippase
MAVFGVSVAVAALPEMSREGTMAALRPHLISGTRRVLYFILPAVMVLLLYGDLAITLIYQRGAFDEDDVTLVRWLLGAYALGLTATSLVKLYASSYHALQDTRTPMKFAAIAVGVGITIGAALMFWMEDAGYGRRAATGLALGGAAGAWLNLTLLSRGLAARGLPGLWRENATPLGRIVLATLLAGGISWPVRALVGRMMDDGMPGTGVELAAVLLAGGSVYLLIAGLGGLRPGRAA